MSKTATNKKKTVFVGLSGGVDSSVAALLLLQEGYNVVGVHLRCWNRGGCDVQEADDARLVAEQLNIPFYVMDLEEEYDRRVVRYMIDGYAQGITPNPDIMCNKEIKFGLFLERALQLGADFVATGHYARNVAAKDIDSKKNYCALYAGVDDNKDQTYFLWTLNQERLNHVLFPIGDYKKPQIRKIAERAKLYTAKKKDSQGICFIGKVPLQFFLTEYMTEKKGQVMTVDGEVVGTHKGAQFYTIGQRHGFTISIKKKQGEHKDRGPFYVVQKDIKKNILIVAEGAEHPSLFAKTMDVAQINWINPDDEYRFVSGAAVSVYARVRYRQKLHAAKVLPARGGKPNQVVFAKPQQYVAEGQSVVFYNKAGECLAGGVIANPEYNFTKAQ